ncbi:hypothetical protein KCU95_g9180, partial [Aureobasidium melanogenum]
MSDVHEDNVTMSELDQEPNTLDSYRLLVKQLRKKLEQRDVALEEAQARIGALEYAQALSSDATAIFNLKQELDATKQELDSAKHRESCGDEREEEQRGYIAELHKMLAKAEVDAKFEKKELEREKELRKTLESDQAELVAELYQKTVDLGVKTALLERQRNT